MKKKDILNNSYFNGYPPALILQDIENNSFSLKDISVSSLRKYLKTVPNTTQQKSIDELKNFLNVYLEQNKKANLASSLIFLPFSSQELKDFSKKYDIPAKSFKIDTDLLSQILNSKNKFFIKNRMDFIFDYMTDYFKELDFDVKKSLYVGILTNNNYHFEKKDILKIKNILYLPFTDTNDRKKKDLAMNKLELYNLDTIVKNMTDQEYKETPIYTFTKFLELIPKKLTSQEQILTKQIIDKYIENQPDMDLNFLPKYNTSLLGFCMLYTGLDKENLDNLFYNHKIKLPKNKAEGFYLLLYAVGGTLNKSISSTENKPIPVNQVQNAINNISFFEEYGFKPLKGNNDEKELLFSEIIFNKKLKSSANYSTFKKLTNIDFSKNTSSKKKLCERTLEIIDINIINYDEMKEYIQELDITNLNNISRLAIKNQKLFNDIPMILEKHYNLTEETNYYTLFFKKSGFDIFGQKHFDFDMGSIFNNLNSLPLDVLKEISTELDVFKEKYYKKTYNFIFESLQDIPNKNIDIDSFINNSIQESMLHINELSNFFDIIKEKDLLLSSFDKYKEDNNNNKNIIKKRM